MFAGLGWVGLGVLGSDEVLVIKRRRDDKR